MPPLAARGRDGADSTPISRSPVRDIASPPHRLTPHRFLRSANSSFSSCVRQLRQPALAGADHRAGDLLLAARSSRRSSLPACRRRRTCAPARRCVWPMRKARSVAWFSTAGFHQRSKWKTWFAAVRFKPGAARLERQDERSAAPSARRLEPLDHPVALLLGRRRRAGTAPRGRTSPAGAAGASSPISANCVKTSARSPARSTSSSISVSRASLPERPAMAELSPQELRRMIAHLLQLRQRRQDHALALDALGCLELSLSSPRRRPRRARPAPWSGCRRPSSPACRAGRR